MTKDLYYYCSAGTLLAMLNNKQLWLTDLTASNDTQEGRWALNEYLDMIPRNTASGRVKRNGARLAISKEVDDRYALGMCFSTKPDLLSQWRGYADQGRGVYLAFDKDALQEFVSAHCSVSPSVSLVSISYGGIAKTTLPKAISDCFSERISSYSEGSNGYGGLVSKVSRERAALDTNVVSQFYHFKNPAFHEEGEWRLLAVGLPEEYSELKFREANGVLSPKLELPFPIELIKGICLGPQHRNSHKKVSQMARHFGFKGDVEVSNATYTSF